MAAIRPLSRIADLVERLAPLNGKQRGMPIEHQEWNTLIDVVQGLLEIDRAREEGDRADLENRFALRSHEHLGQVNGAWLDADLQAGLGGGGGGPSVRAALADTESKVGSLGDAVARLTNRLEEQQKALDRFSVSDSDRSRALRDFDARFAGVENLRTLVATVNGQVTSLGTQVNTVLELRKSLSDPEGNPIDVARIGQDVRDLQRLGTSLNGIDGKPVRMLDIELRLKEMADATGIGASGGLDGRLNVLATDMEDRVGSRVDANVSALRADVLARQAEASEQTKADLIATQQADRAAVDQALTSRIADTETRLTTSLASSLTTGFEAARVEIAAATTATIDLRLADVPGQVKEAITAERPAIEAALSNSLASELTATVNAQVAAAETRLDARSAATETRLIALQDQAQTATRTNLDDAVSRLSADLATNLDARLARARTAIDAGLDARLEAANNELAAGVDAKLRAGIDRSLADLDTRVDGSVADALKTLPEQVNDAVRLEVALVDVAGPVQSSASAVTDQLRAELTRAIADQQARTSGAVDGVLSQLRGELSAAVNSGVATASQNASTAIGSLRDEIKGGFRDDLAKLDIKLANENKRLDVRIDNVRITG